MAKRIAESVFERLVFERPGKVREAHRALLEANWEALNEHQRRVVQSFHQGTGLKSITGATFRNSHFRSSELYATAVCAAHNRKYDGARLLPEHYELLQKALLPALEPKLRSALWLRTSSLRSRREMMGIAPVKGAYRPGTARQEKLVLLLELGGFPKQMEKALRMRADYLLGQAIARGEYQGIRFTRGEREAFEEIYGQGTKSKQLANKLTIETSSISKRLEGVRSKLRRAYSKLEEKS